MEKLQSLAIELQECAVMIKNMNTDDVNDIEELYGRLMDLRTDIKYKGLQVLEEMV